MLLGCLQPGQPAATYVDALNRLSDRLHYLNSTGDKTQDTTRYWFDTRANLRREMEDRKRRFEGKPDERGKIAEALKKMLAGATFFDGVHIFTPHQDVSDDTALRLVVLTPEQWYSRDEERTASHAVLEYVRNNGSKPRYRGNRLIFLAPDMAILNRLQDVARTALAWKSIVDDVEERRLTLDNLQSDQAKKELRRPKRSSLALHVNATNGCSVQSSTQQLIQTNRRSIPTEYNRWNRRQRTRASLLGQRACDYHLGSNPSSHEVERALLERW